MQKKKTPFARPELNASRLARHRGRRSSAPAPLLARRAPSRRGFGSGWRASHGRGPYGASSWRSGSGPGSVSPLSADASVNTNPTPATTNLIPAPTDLSPTTTDLTDATTELTSATTDVALATSTPTSAGLPSKVDAEAANVVPGAFVAPLSVSPSAPAAVPTPPTPYQSSVTRVTDFRWSWHRKECFGLGTIIRALHMEEHRLNLVPNTPVHAYGVDAFATADQDVGISKYRHFCVIKSFSDSYVAVPVYTYGGRGLTNSSKPLEYLSLKDHREGCSFVAQNNNPILTTEVMNVGTGCIHSRAVVHFNYPISMLFSKRVQIWGYLDEQSATILHQHYYQHIFQPAIAAATQTESGQ